MTISEILFVRACKSLDPYLRVRSVYRRFYGIYTEEITDAALVDILADIVDRYVPMTTFEVMRDLDPLRGIFSYEIKDFKKVCVHTLISRIRYADVKRFEGFIPPTKFARG